MHYIQLNYAISHHYVVTFTKALPIQSDLTYLHTSVSGGFVDKVRELDK